MLALQLLLALGFLAAEGLSLTFVNPPTAGKNKDYSADPVYQEGSTVTIAWSGSASGLPVTLSMFQQEVEDGVGDASQDVLVGTSSHRIFTDRCS